MLPALLAVGKGLAGAAGKGLAGAAIGGGSNPGVPNSNTSIDKSTVNFGSYNPPNKPEELSVNKMAIIGLLGLLTFAVIKR